MVQGQHGEHTLNPARATQQMAGHGLGGVDHGLLGMVTQRSLDGVGFVQVTNRGGRAVGVEVVDLVGVDARVFHGHPHGTGRAVHAGCCHMVRVARHAKTHDFSVDLGAAGLGVFVFFNNQHTGTFTQHKTVAVFVPGAGCGGGVVVAGGQRAGRGKTGHTQRRHGGFGTAGHHHVAVAVFDHAGRLTDGM